ncbi:MAG: formate dehydrogenase accessory protein FdhE [Myxococcales bacterium]
MRSRASKAAPELIRRAERAAAIETLSPAAAEPLRFVSALFRAQADLAVALEGGAPLTGALSRDAPALIEPSRALLDAIAKASPPPLARTASERATESGERLVGRLQIFWAGDLGSGEDYLSRAVLRPYCATLAALSLAPDRPRGEGGCPFCGGAPIVAAQRPEGDGARRMLCCALCGGEWPVNRIRCPACGEEDPPRLPNFKSDAHPFARIEACDTCRRYVKAIDLSQDGRLVPEVDDLASLGLDLWASGEGYTRIEPGLAGL